MISRTIQAWVYVNRNGTIGMSIDEPVRDKESGKWIAKKLFCNSQLYEMVKNTVQKTEMNWMSEPEFFEINI